LRYAPVRSLWRIEYPERVKSVETEIKLRVKSVRKMRALLGARGFRIIKPRVFEQNLVLDDPAGSLRERGMLLRVRSAGKLVTCTFKGEEKPGRHKIREEHEFQASDFKAALAVFTGLGYREAFRYEKYRTEFAREGEYGHAMLDETPAGNFMELEGPARWIDRTAKAFGFTDADYVLESYSRLWDTWLEEHAMERRDMRF
jgi:adenylate cyclase, class 2